jgi:hypothetical protein
MINIATTWTRRDGHVAFPTHCQGMPTMIRHTKVGTITAAWEHFADWKRVECEEEAPQSTIERAIRATCEPTRLLDLIENFTLSL